MTSSSIVNWPQRLRLTLLSLVLLVVVANPEVPGLPPLAAARAATVKRCHLPAYASGELMTRGVGCIAADRVVRHALAHPGCRPKPKDVASSRGCYGRAEVDGWICTGLFPGEGFDLRCRRGARRIHAGAGG